MAEVKKVPARNEIEEESKWDLTPLYQTDADWEKEFALVEERIPQLEEFRGHLGESAQQLYDFMKQQDETALLYDRLVVYSNQKMHEDMSVSTYQGYAARAAAMGAAFGSAVSFAEPEILQISAELLEQFYQDCPSLELYRVSFDRLQKKREHTLSDAEEKLLAAAGEMAAGPKDVFSLFNNADLKFGTIRDADGSEVQLSLGNYVSFLMNPDREVRKAAFYEHYKTYGAFRNTLGALYASNAKQAKFYADARKYESSLELSLLDSEIPVSVYESLIEAVHAHLPEMYRYVALRKKLLGVDELHMYDVYVPIVADVDMKVTYEQAKEMALEGLAPMGEEYLELLKRGFSERWIDVYENQNKRSGAYSWGAYGTHPYVLLNFQGTIDDVFTLVHEMGHSLHTYYTNENQPFAYSGYRLFVAEVASTCNESLLMHHLLAKTTDPKQKAYLVNHFLDQFKGTLYRQTMFAEFEKITHAKQAEGEPLTADGLCELYLELNKKYFGEEMVSDPEIALEWAKIPHFYSEFYVYQYATGFSAAIALSKKILEEGEPAVEAYKSFLKGGCSTDPISLLQMAGVDMSTSAPVEAALTYFGELVEELERLTLA